MVFVDSGGSFNNDTECVNGVRGNVADHLTKDVVPYVNAHYGTSASSADWGIVGWSMGGTCAVDLTVMHPELFSSFLDIAGDTGPNAGTKDQTVARLYGGNAGDVGAVRPGDGDHQTRSLQGCFGMVRHLHRQADAAQVGRRRRRRRARRPRRGRACRATRPRPPTRCAASAGRKGITCSVVPTTGRHDWPLATQVFTAALPWLAGAVHTPGVPAVPLPAGAPVTACRTRGIRGCAGRRWHRRAAELSRRARAAARGCGPDPLREASNVAATYSSPPLPRAARRGGP